MSSPAPEPQDIKGKGSTLDRLRHLPDRWKRHGKTLREASTTAAPAAPIQPATARKSTPDQAPRLDWEPLPASFATFFGAEEQPGTDAGTAPAAATSTALLPALTPAATPAVLPAVTPALATAPAPVLAPPATTALTTPSATPTAFAPVRPGKPPVDVTARKIRFAPDIVAADRGTGTGTGDVRQLPPASAVRGKAVLLPLSSTPLPPPVTHSIRPLFAPLRAGALAAPDLLAAPAPVAPAAQRPVIRQDGSLDQASLLSFVDRLRARLPPAGQTANKKVKQEHQALDEELGNLGRLAGSPHTLDAEQQLKVRDHFARAARKAQDLGKSLLASGGARSEAPSDALFFSCLGANLAQLKRIHLTAASPAVMQAFVDRERKNLLAKVPTLDHMSSSMVSKDTSAGTTYNGGVFSVGLGMLKNETFWFDDDRDINFWNGLGVSVKGGGPSTWIISAAINLGIDLGGAYFETETLEEVLKLIVNRDANHAWTNSADPKIRQARLRVKQGYNAVAQTVGGFSYTEAAGKPHFLSDKKLNKGVDSASLQVMGEALDHISAPVPGEQPFGEFFAQAYPSAKARLQDNFDQGGYQDPLSNMLPMSDPVGHGAAPYRNYYANATGSIGKSLTLAAGVSAAAQVSASARWNTAQFHLENVESSHRLLDPAYHADMSHSFELIARLDALLVQGKHRHSKGRAPAKLTLYERVQKQLGGKWPEGQEFEAEREHYYGPFKNIPPQFRASLLSSSTDEIDRKLKLADDCSRILLGNYMDFVGNAGIIATRTDLPMPRETYDHIQARRTAAFEAINAMAWGAEPGNPQGGYPGGAEAALREPEKFMAATHDAIGLALGSLGVHVAVLKRQMAELLLPEDTVLKQRAMARIQKTDTAYLHAKTLMDKANLPMKIEHVYLKEATFQDRGLSQRHNLILRASANLGLKFNIFEALAQRFGKSTGDYQVTNEAGQFAAVAQCRYQYADHQINPSRQGNFLEFKFTAQQGMPLGWDVIINGIMKGLKKFHPEMDKKDEQKQESHLLDQLQGIVWDKSQGGDINLRIRRFPGAAGMNFDLQFVRKHQINTSGQTLSAPLPTPVGKFGLNYSKLNTLQNSYFESFGPDISYMMLQHKKLKKLLRQGAENTRNIEGHGLSENQVMALQLKNKIADHPVLRNHFEGSRNMRWVAEAYFTQKDLITGVLDRYQHYADTVAQAQREGKNPADLPQDNEFFRYFEKTAAAEPFHRVAQVAREARHFAPGASVSMTDRLAQVVGEPKDPFEVPPDLLQKIAAPVLPSGRSWEEEKRHIHGLKKLDERIDYFFSDEGRPVLDTFIRIIETTKEVHDLSRHRVHDTLYGFKTSLKNPAERKKADIIIGGDQPGYRDRMLARLHGLGLRPAATPPAPTPLKSTPQKPVSAQEILPPPEPRMVDASPPLVVHVPARGSARAAREKSVRAEPSRSYLEALKPLEPMAIHMPFERIVSGA